MAIFHFSAQVIGRSAGRSSVAASAYRAGIALVDARTGLRHDYTKKTGLHGSEIMTPANAPAWMNDRQKLVDGIEASEVRHDAQLCREINIALPVELTQDQNKNLVRDFVRNQFTSVGMIADVAFHHLETTNPHAHLLLTMRHIDGDKFGKKNREWNRPELLRKWREQWAESVNQTLATHGHEARINAGSLIDQRAEILPTETEQSDALLRLPTIHHGGKSEAKMRNSEILKANREAALSLVQMRSEKGPETTPPSHLWQEEDPKKERQQVEKMEARQQVKDCQKHTNTLAKEAREHVERLRTMEQEAATIATKKRDQEGAWTRRQNRMVEAMKRADEWERNHPIRAALGWQFSRPLQRLKNTARTARKGRDKSKARHDQATALGEEFAQGMRNNIEDTRKLNRELEKARQQEDEAWACIARLKERHRWENLTPDQRETETQARAKAREARHHSLSGGQTEVKCYERALPAPQNPPERPQRPTRPRGMGR
jgi:ATP-dependent exoDNAse (exonuclease V) alpha subunit